MFSFLPSSNSSFLHPMLPYPLSLSPILPLLSFSSLTPYLPLHIFPNFLLFFPASFHASIYSSLLLIFFLPGLFSSSTFLLLYIFPFILPSFIPCYCIHPHFLLHSFVNIFLLTTFLFYFCIFFLTSIVPSLLYILPLLSFKSCLHIFSLSYGFPFPPLSSLLPWFYTSCNLWC